MIITKFKLISQSPPENEFETTRTKKTTSIIATRSLTDDEGNVISVNRVIPPTIKNHITEEITAVSLPSRTPARVEILEVIDNNSEEIEVNRENSESVKNNGPKIMKGPQRQKPITLDKLHGREKPMVIKNQDEDDGGIKWV